MKNSTHNFVVAIAIAASVLFAPASSASVDSRTTNGPTKDVVVVCANGVCCYWTDTGRVCNSSQVISV